MVNLLQIIGRMGASPIMRNTNEGVLVANFTVAVNEKRKRGNRVEEKTTWFNCTAYGRQAEIARDYLSKGAPVYVQGRVSASIYTRPDNGEAVINLNVAVERFTMLPGSGSGEQPSAGTKPPMPPAVAATAASGAGGLDDDVPF